MSHNKETLNELGMTIEDLIYNAKSLFYITEFIEVLNAIRTPETLSPRTKQIIIFEILVKYTQLIESFAALINAFEKSNKNIPNTNVVINYLVRYDVKSALKDYNFLYSEKPEIHDRFKNKIKNAFGYANNTSYIKVNESVDKIISLLIPIFQVYYFHTRSYNASKHGHRIFHMFNKEPTNTNIPVIYLDRKTTSSAPLHSNEPEHDYHIDWISTDSKIVDQQFNSAIEDFAKIYEILIHNNKALIEKRISDIIYYEY